MSEKYICPCCGFRTLDEPPPGTFDICPICFWEDDNVQYNDPDFVGGANQVSLNRARKNYQEFGATELRCQPHVRKPMQDEILEKLSRISGVPVDIEAELTLISPENGGREKQFFCGMRPQFYYDGQDWDCTLQILNDPVFAHGQTITAFFGFVTPSAHFGKLVLGKEFLLRDGHKVIAQGRVKAVWSLARSNS
jgi:hypothetical protein